MKDRLNVIKGRAGYRPIAPICLSALSSDVFVPGSDDPYMLFEHRLRDGWADRIPAIVHLDGTARLQTIDLAADSVTARILAAYVEISGIPVLCNTSANFNGRGFFPDVASAAKWGGTRYIWSAGALYINPQALDSLQDRWECMAQNRPTEGKGSAAETSVDEVEEIVGQIFAKVLAIEDVGLDDDFFALGGHSIAAGRVIGMVRRELDARVNLFEFFEEPSVRGLVRLIIECRSAFDSGQASAES
jgi:acyl carrier protein